eukprot:gene22156-29219_t
MSPSLLKVLALGLILCLSLPEHTAGMKKSKTFPPPSPSPEAPMIKVELAPPPISIPPAPPLPPADSDEIRVRDSFRAFFMRSDGQSVIDMSNTSDFEADFAIAASRAFHNPESEESTPDGFLMREIGIINRELIADLVVDASLPGILGTEKLLPDAFIGGLYVDFDISFPQLMLIRGSTSLAAVWRAPIPLPRFPGRPIAFVTMNYTFAAANNWFYQPDPCTDLDGMCTTWAVNGDCLTNPGFMVGEFQGSNFLPGVCLHACGKCSLCPPVLGYQVSHAAYPSCSYLDCLAGPFHNYAPAELAQLCDGTTECIAYATGLTLSTGFASCLIAEGYQQCTIMDTMRLQRTTCLYENILSPNKFHHCTYVGGRNRDCSIVS